MKSFLLFFLRTKNNFYSCFSIGMASNTRTSVFKWWFRWIDLFLARWVRKSHCSSLSICQRTTMSFFYRTDKELAGMDDAHEGMIWDMSWHPLGHMLVSGSNDHTTYVFMIGFFTDVEQICLCRH